MFLSAFGLVYDPVSVSFLDLQSGAQTPVGMAGPPMPEIFLQPNAGSRVIANDGTAVLPQIQLDQSGQSAGFIS